MNKQFVPAIFTVPITFKSNHFCFVPLAPKVAVEDYEAVMSSLESLKGIFGKYSDWPKKSLTLNENITDLEQHEAEFDGRLAFAYSVFNSSSTLCLGSIYIGPSQSSEFNCDVFYWIRDSHNHLETDLKNEIKKWLRDFWPFKKIAYPGRDISWEDWESILGAVDL